MGSRMRAASVGRPMARKRSARKNSECRSISNGWVTSSVTTPVPRGFPLVLLRLGQAGARPHLEAGLEPGPPPDERDVTVPAHDRSLPDVDAVVQNRADDAGARPHPH